jgi:hypothetical protein
VFGTPYEGHSTNCMGQTPSTKAYSQSTHLAPLMEHYGSLQCSQQPATGHYPQPDASSPHLTHPTSLRSILILSSQLRLDLPSGLFLSGFPTKIPYAFIGKTTQKRNSESAEYL